MPDSVVDPLEYYAGNTVLITEHNLDVIKAADWIVDLGPEGGDAGGYTVAQGRPEQVAQVEASYTGAFLRPLLGGDKIEARPSSIRVGHRLSGPQPWRSGDGHGLITFGLL